jgi:Cytidylate kinase-like family
VIRIVAIEREFGCGGQEIAKDLTACLGWKLWDELLTLEVARLSKSAPGAVQRREWRKDPLVYRIFKAFLRGAFEGRLPPTSQLELLDAERIARLSEHIVKRAASSGPCVIVGRGSQYFLRDREDAFRVFLYAPREEKIRRLTSAGTPLDRAVTQVDSVDRDRAAFIKKYFEYDWPDRNLYHIMINTASGDRLVVRQLACCMQAFDPSLRASWAGFDRESSSKNAEQQL